jgi:hypothetical protein
LFDWPSAQASTIRLRKRIAGLVPFLAARWVSAARSADDNVSGDLGRPASGMAAW